MLNYLLYLIFILSVAFAAGGVMISSKLRNRYHHEIYSELLYYQVFMYTFGFYGIWGQVVINLFLQVYISPQLLSRFSDFAMVMGFPFLVFAWLMLVTFSLDISGRKHGKWFVFLFLLLNFSILILVGYIITKTESEKPASLIRYYFISMHFLYSLIFSLLMTFSKKRSSIIHDHDRKIIAPVVFFIMLLQSVMFVFYTSHPFLVAGFILTFFAGNTFLPIYLNYGTILSLFADENKKDLLIEDLCKRYEVSSRETDVVREICNGLSNKEISDKLFISLQTVKDHTHRIYIKTNVKSRVQLINLVRESLG